MAYKTFVLFVKIKIGTLSNRVKIEDRIMFCGNVNEV